MFRFHAIYWPAFLMAAGLEPPRSLLVHSHWTMEHQKMSKSKGNVVDPVACIQTYAEDGLRYFLLREGVPHSDGSYSELKAITLLNAELADTLGNLMNRCTTPALNQEQVFPIICEREFKDKCHPEGDELVLMVRNLPATVGDHYSDFNYYHGLEELMRAMRKANQFFDTQKPWQLKKDSQQKRHLGTVIGTVLETLRVGGILLQPVVPRLADRLLTRLGIPLECRAWGLAENSFPTLRGEGGNAWEERPLGTNKELLFRKIQEEQKMPKAAKLNKTTA